MDKRRLVLACAVITLVTICIITAVIFAMSRREPPSATPPSPITATGNLVCLPHKNVAPGQPQTLECAIGLKAQDGNFYGLSGLSQQDSTTDFSKTVNVSGTLVPPEANNKYDIRGTIKVNTFVK
ncbi:MAG TPA: hypothetical protein VFO38_03500 [Candidatus Saccharimonadales bacterium]|nr:hypothetical protein [Candidatus Saccharimonadales bacterium]